MTNKHGYTEEDFEASGDVAVMLVSMCVQATAGPQMAVATMQTALAIMGASFCYADAPRDRVMQSMREAMDEAMVEMWDADPIVARRSLNGPRPTHAGSDSVM